MPEQRRRSMGLRASQLTQDGTNDSVLIGSPVLSRARSAERSFSASNSSFDYIDGIAHSNSNRSELSKNNSSICSLSNRQRSNSDPFDDGGDEFVKLPVSSESTDISEVGRVEQVKALPTLHRFPCTQTRNQNCWSETPPEIFTVRGPKYLSGDQTKIKCDHYLLRSRGCDLILTNNNNNKNAIKILEGGLSGNLRKKPTFLFRFLFPWGMLLQYYEVPQKLVPFMKMGMGNDEKKDLSIEGFSNAEKALARWLVSNDAEFKSERLKLIAIVPEGPWIVRNLVTGKPALIGKRLQVRYKYIPQKGSVNCLQICDLDISSGTAIAKKTVNVTKRYLSSLKAVDIGFVIEGKTPAELPEEMMGSTRLHQVDPTQAPTV